MADQTTVGHYDIVLIRRGDSVGVRSPKRHRGEDLVEVWETNEPRIREFFINRFTRANLCAEMGVGRCAKKAANPPVEGDGEVSRVTHPDPQLALEGYVLVTYERPRDLDALDKHLYPYDLDWKAVREWLVTQE